MYLGAKWDLVTSFDASKKDLVVCQMKFTPRNNCIVWLIHVQFQCTASFYKDNQQYTQINRDIDAAHFDWHIQASSSQPHCKTEIGDADEIESDIQELSKLTLF